MEITRLQIERDRLGEGAVWDHRSGQLYWTDHLDRTIRSYSPRDGSCQAWQLPKTTGCLALTDDPSRLVVALADSFVVLDLASGKVTEVAFVPQPREAIRLSDGRADRCGAFVVGSAVTDFAGYEGMIYRLNPDFSVEVIRTGMMLSNAICFRQDGRVMHFTDTRSGIVMACDYEAGIAALPEAREFGDAREHGASPDGATVDSEGGVWVAQIRTGDVTRFNADGSFSMQIELPVPHATSVAFGGDDLSTLYVTTVRETGMQIKSDHPDAGAIFAVTGTGFKGVPEGIFRLG